MVLQPIWHDSTNVISFIDADFDSAADSFVLIFEHEQNCSRFNIDISGVETCEEQVKFQFEMNCSILSGQYLARIHNTTLDEEYTCIKVKVYKNLKTCLNCK